MRTVLKNLDFCLFAKHFFLKKNLILDQVVKKLDIISLTFKEICFSLKLFNKTVSQVLTDHSGSKFSNKASTLVCNLKGNVITGSCSPKLLVLLMQK